MFEAKIFIKTTFSFDLTTDGDFFAVAGGDAVDIWQHAEQLPRLQEQLEDVT